MQDLYHQPYEGTMRRAIRFAVPGYIIVFFFWGGGSELWEVVYVKLPWYLGFGFPSRWVYDYP